MLKPQAPFVFPFQKHQSNLWEERAWGASGRERRREEALLRRGPSRLLMGSMPAGWSPLGSCKMCFTLPERVAFIPC